MLSSPWSSLVNFPKWSIRILCQIRPNTGQLGAKYGLSDDMFGQLIKPCKIINSAYQARKGFMEDSLVEEENIALIKTNRKQ